MSAFPGEELFTEIVRQVGKAFGREVVVLDTRPIDSTAADAARQAIADMDARIPEPDP